MELLANCILFVLLFSFAAVFLFALFAFLMNGGWYDSGCSQDGLESLVQQRHLPYGTQMTQRKWHEVSVDIEQVIGTKFLSVNGYQKHHNVFVDLYLTSGATIQIALDFTDEQRAAIESQAGPKPDHSPHSPVGALYQLVGERPRRKRFESRNSYTERIKPWSDNYWAWKKASAAHEQARRKWVDTVKEVSEPLGQQVYEDFVKDLNLVTSPQIPQDQS